MIYIKRESEKLDYIFDFTNFLGYDVITAASISTVNVADGSLSYDLGLDPLVFSDTAVRQFVASGISGNDYTLTCTINTVGGRTKEMDMTLRIQGI